MLDTVSAKSELTPLLPPTTGITTDGGLGHTWPAQLAPSFVGRVLFTWVDPLMALGARRPLQLDDLFQLDPSDRATRVGHALLHHWTHETKPATPSLTRALTKTFGPSIARAGVLKLVLDVLQFVLPLMIQRILAFLQDPTAPLARGLGDAAIVAGVSLTQSLLLRSYAFQCFRTGLRVRSALSAVVFRKTLVLSSAAQRRSPPGAVTNLLTADVARVQNIATHINSLWFSVFQIVVACVLLWQQLGVAMLAGVAVILTMVPTTGDLSRRLRTFQHTLMNAKDARLKRCYEVLAGIKVIKLQAWERAFATRVLSLRDKELDALDAYVRVRSATSAVFAAVPALVAATSFLTFVLCGNALDVGTALTSLALFNILRFPLMGFPALLSSVVEASVSVERLRAFLCEEERVTVGAGDLPSIGIRIQHADFTWDHEDETTTTTKKATLRGVEIEATSGQLWAIVGGVGAGKSTLLSALLGDARCVRGSIAVRGSVAYVAQQQFIANATVRDNITFGRAFDATRYADAVRVSALTPDLATLPAGDATELGEKGVTLSGGQRTRVALARAVYQDADIYVLDDVFAAVDAHVGREIFTGCIQQTLRHKLVVLTTHSRTYLDQCDRVVVLANGTVVESGAYDEVMGLDNGVLRGLLGEQAHSPDCDDDEEKETASVSVVSPSTGKAHAATDIAATTTASSGRLLVDEDRATGDVQWPVYTWWLNAMGDRRRVIVFVAVVFCGAQALDVLATTWLSRWSQHAAPTTTSQLSYLAVYVALNALVVGGLYLRSILVLLRGLRASRVLYDVVFRRVLCAPLAFFDTTPLGRIVNRLAKDVYALDESLPSTAAQLAGTIVSVAATLVTISVITPMFLVVLLPVGAGFYRAQRYFVQTSRELQRLDAISRSPVIALLTETLDGLPTIHAFRVEATRTTRFDALLDRSQRASFLTFAANGWLGLRLDVAGALIATCAALAAVLMAHGHRTLGDAYDQTAINAFAARAGVSLAYAFSVTHALNHSVRALSQLQTQMVSVERLQTYADMASEGDENDKKDEATPATSDAAWPPRAGAIAFRDVTLRYRIDTPRVLHGLSFSIQAGEKVGVVGRTGAGKSSLVVALLRLVALEHGAIVIDGVDILTLPLRTLRRAIGIIPQKPVLFTGSVRSNVDPLDAYDDAEIWTALRRAQLLDETSSAAVVSLDARVDERGANWSVGQRQLLCIARALLAQTRIVVMDEATASIDGETDRAIQRAMREAFRDCTCLTIAHRLDTVLDADRVLVMDDGRVAEFDTPAALLANAQSHFKALVDRARE